MNKTNESLYSERKARIEAAVKFEDVDMIPCLFMGTAFAPRYMGMSQKEFCLDATAAVDVTIDAMKKLGDVDGINLMPSGLHPMNLTNLWLSKVLIPGIDLGDEDLWQVQEKEMMAVEDYDFILENGYPAFLQKIIPQVCDLEMMIQHNEWNQEYFSGIAGKFRDAGYSVTVSAITTIPFEPICGARSMTKFYFDLYRIPDKVEEALDSILPFYIELAKNATKASGVPCCWVGGWRTASAMLAPQLWDRFVWPHFKKAAEELIKEGITPVFHWDQDWTRDLERILELPAKKCILNLDGMTDIRKAKDILDDHTALMGDLPSSILSSGTTDEVRNYIRDLINDVGHKGLILAPGCDGPLNSKPENMEAFVEASREFGKC